MIQEVIADVLAHLLVDELADKPYQIVSYEEFQLFGIWTNLGENPHTYLIHRNTSAHKEPPKRRLGSKPPFRSMSLIYLEPNKETIIFLHLDVTQSFMCEPGYYLKAFPCTPPHLIRWVKFEQHFPYMDPFDITLQRFLPYLFVCVLEMLQSLRKLPISRTCLTKLTRYKTHLTCLIWTNFYA